MSLFKKIFKGVKKVAKVGIRTIAGSNPYAAAATGLIGSSSGSARMTMAQSMGGIQSFASLPTLARGAGTLARRAGGAIRRNAGTVATVGGTAAILYDQFGNPVRRKRRRGKGITARELKSFTRVTGLLNKYCKTPPPTKRRSASRSSSCR